MWGTWAFPLPLEAGPCPGLPSFPPPPPSRVLGAPEGGPLTTKAPPSQLTAASSREVSRAHPDLFCSDLGGRFHVRQRFRGGTWPGRSLPTHHIQRCQLLPRKLGVAEN